MWLRILKAVGKAILQLAEQHPELVADVVKAVQRASSPPATPSK